MRKVLIGLVLTALGLAATPTTVQACGFGLCHWGSGQPAAYGCNPPFNNGVIELTPGVANTLPPAPPGFKWIFEQQPVTVTRLVPQTVDLGGGRFVTRMVPVQETQTRSVARLVPEVVKTVVDELAALTADVEKLRKALGLANVADAERALIQQELEKIKQRLGIPPGP